MEGDRNAPVFSEGKVEIGASAGALWDLMADIERWPTWNPDVREASVQGDLAEGTRFRWKAGPGTITSTLRVVDRPRAIGWTGRTFGIDAIHVWRFEARGNTTVASMEESFDGFVARLFRRRLQRQLDTTTKAGLENLKTVAERESST